MMPWRVVVFLAPLCPICQDYTAFLNALNEAWADEPVELVGLFPGEEVTEDDIASFAERYHVTWEMALDVNGMADSLGAAWTPEVFVLDADGAVHYRGRVNDFYYALGKHRAKPKTHDLRDAVAALLDGRAPRDSTTQAIGCPIP